MSSKEALAPAAVVAIQAIRMYKSGKNIIKAGRL